MALIKRREAVDGMLQVQVSIMAIGLKWGVWGWPSIANSVGPGLWAGDRVAAMVHKHLVVRQWIKAHLTWSHQHHRHQLCSFPL
jgi:hypothetical protein